MTATISQLEGEIRRFIKEHNGKAKPFVWTKPVKTILEKLRRLPDASLQ
jgi:phage-related protein